MNFHSSSTSSFVVLYFQHFYFFRFCRLKLFYWIRCKTDKTWIFLFSFWMPAVAYQGHHMVGGNVVFIQSKYYILKRRKNDFWCLNTKERIEFFIHLFLVLEDGLKPPLPTSTSLNASTFCFLIFHNISGNSSRYICHTQLPLDLFWE